MQIIRALRCGRHLPQNSVMIQRRLLCICLALYALDGTPSATMAAGQSVAIDVGH